MVLLEERGSTIESMAAPEDVDVGQGTQKQVASERHATGASAPAPPEARPQPGDSGPLWRPLALTWNFSGQVGRSHYGDGLAPSFWSSATDLGRVLKRMHLSLVL